MDNKNNTDKCDIKKYINNYNLFTKKIIYQFEYGFGGIGDYLKFYIYMLDFCIKNDIQLLLSINHPLNNYIKLKYDYMYIKFNNTKNYISINDITQLNKIEENNYYIIKPFVLYIVDQDVKHICLKWTISSIFYFTNEIINEYNKIINNEQYISIHLRLGDKFLETDNNYVICKEDTRDYNQNILENFIEINREKNIYFFCDNNNFKQILKNKYPYINITNFKIEHTSLLNTSEEGTKNSIIEFCLLSYSSKIYWASYSGFSFMASRFLDCPYINVSYN